MTEGWLLADLCVGLVPVYVADSEFHEGVDAESGFDWVVGRLVETEGVPIAPSDPFPAQVAALLEVSHDCLDGALGDLAGGGHITQPCARVTCDGYQDPRVVGQEGASPVRAIHGAAALRSSG